MHTNGNFLTLFLTLVALFSSTISALDFVSLLAPGGSLILPASANSTTGSLSVKGASLYYETYGTGPLLLFISGANGDAEIWRPIAKTLATNYTVAIYDRRGFSRSYLAPTAIQNYTTRLETDASDASALIDHLAPGGNATVLGTSSGAIVALQLLQSHPKKLKTLIAHEPPLLTILPDAANLTLAQQQIYTVYRAAGIPAALYAFSLSYDGTAPKLGGNAVPGFTVDSRENAYAAGNWQYWFERELMQYPLHEVNVTNVGLYREKLVLANGNETKEVDPQWRSNAVLGEKLGLDVVSLAGQHTGYAGETMAAFAEDLLGMLAKRA
ncbi:hypothetical protein N0V90_011018 [Kalmusia sp. IMI 367209]|nr:hypothetical protein N0V90_011018 [Kalmusia sp. IMI 367209]